MKQRIRDRRRLPFFQVTKADLASLACACEKGDSSVRLSSVRSVYFALLEITNDERSDTAEVTRKELGERGGVSTRTITDVVPVLVAAGLLEVEKREGYADVWVLISAEEGEQQLQGGSGNDCRGGVQPLQGSYIEESQEGENTPPTPSLPDPVGEVFDHWCKVMDHPGAQLDFQRRAKIQKALGVASLEECLWAINGCASSDYHMARGEYNSRTRYDSLSLILRDREKIEWFMAMTPQTGDPRAAKGGRSSALAVRIREAKRNVLAAYDLAGSDEARRKGDESEHWLERHGIRVLRDGSDKRPQFKGPDQ